MYLFFSHCIIWIIKILQFPFEISNFVKIQISNSKQADTFNYKNKNSNSTKKIYCTLGTLNMSCLHWILLVMFFSNTSVCTFVLRHLHVVEQSQVTCCCNTMSSHLQLWDLEKAQWWGNIIKEEKKSTLLLYAVT